MKAVLSDDDFEEILSSLIREYYDHCKVEEVIVSLIPLDYVLVLCNLFCTLLLIVGGP